MARPGYRSPPCGHSPPSREAVVLGDGGPAPVPALVRGGVDTGVADCDGVMALARAEQRGFDRIARILRAAPGA